jgi:diguanylate cyclase (GGDEF)-like protein
MSGPRTDRRVFVAYACVCTVAAVVHPLLPPEWRPASFSLFSAGTLGPIALRLRREPAGGRLPWGLLALAMLVLTSGNGVIAVFGRSQKMTAEFGVTVGHAVLLAAALALVVRRGRNDLGGLLDASVALMSIGTLLWAGLLQPHLEGTHSTLGGRVALLVSVYVLTGLPNRAELHRRLDAALAQEQEQEPDVVLLFCDLDGFKPINDRLGHAAGDELLVALAARLRAGLRAGETVARYGGDEFVLLARAEDRDGAVRRLTRHVRAALAEPFVVAGEPVTVGASVGAVASDGRTGADGLIRRADEAMYEMKRRTARRSHPVPMAHSRG